MKTIFSKKEVFLMSLFSVDTLLFFIFSAGFLAVIYFTDLDGNAKNVVPLAIMFFSLLVILIVVLYFYTLSMLKKIVSIIHNQRFVVTSFDSNSPPKLEINKHKREFVLTLTSISIRGTSLIIEPKEKDNSSEPLEKQELYTRYDSIKKLNGILKEIIE